jgi:ABC-type multidrug transport system fused ATPase/permease subunit
MSGGLLVDGRQLLGYVAYVARNFKAFYLVAALTGLALVLEYAATSLMIPLAPGNIAADSVVTVFWTRVAAAAGLEPTPRTWLWLFVIVLLARVALGYVLVVQSTWLGKRVHRALSGKVFSHIVTEEPMSRVYTRSIGHYITMAGDDTFKSGTILANLLQAAVGASTAVVALVVLYQFSPSFFGWVAGFLLVSLAGIGLLMTRVLAINARAVDLSRELGTTFIEALNSLRSIRSLQAGSFVVSTYAAQIRAYVRMLVVIEAIKSAVRTAPALGLLFIAAMLLRPGSTLEASAATLIAATAIVIRVFAALGQMVTSGAQVFTDIRAVKDIGALVELASHAPVAAVETPAPEVRSVTLRSVWFGYGDRGQVLSGVDFRFEAGRTYAIVGPSGAGKSTVADILLGLTSPDRGEVLVNDGAVDLALARRRFALVEQQSKIFSTTLRENLLLGAQASDSALHSALEAVSLGELVRSLGDGLDTRLSYLGENFSGGQRQRLGIARALVRNPQVLILDEATSALDQHVRASLVDRLRERMSAGIIVFITHDPAIEDIADEVLRVEPAGGAGTQVP